MTHPLARPASILVALLALTACTPPPAPTPPPASPSAPVLLSPAPYGVPEDDDGPGPGDPEKTRTPAVAPTADVDRTDAAATAVQAMTLFARQSVTAEQWIDELAVYMTPQAAQDYSHVDPNNVPATAVTGPGKVIPTDSAWLARVQVPTNVGAYLVILSRTEEDPTWRVARITPPEKAE